MASEQRRYDTKCEELARVFLEDLCGRCDEGFVDAYAPQVAQAIQDAIEAELQAIEAEQQQAAESRR